MNIQAVVTTGIYCRADCGGRPKPENVRAMPNPIAALAAGYRPCLVCRPDRLPNMGVEHVAPEITRAMRLIAEGFLDNASTNKLAEQIGYSVRHLNRLFEQHIGASPDFVARARRAHLARRLLDESQLSITEITFASGFSSVRQMNRVIKSLFGFSPTALRAKRLRNDVLDPLDGGLRLRVPYRRKFDVCRAIEYLRDRAIPGIENVSNNRYQRTINTCGHPGVAEIEPGDDQGHLKVTMHLATFGSILEQVERVRLLFNLDHDYSEAHRHLGADPVLGPLIRDVPGLRVPGAWDRFETAIRIMVGQQVSVTGASTVTGRLAERWGERIEAPLPGSLGYLFPGASALASGDTSEFSMPQARARAIQQFAARVADGEIDLLAMGTLKSVVDNLMATDGIGPWTAQMIAGRVMQQHDAFPASDLGLRKSMAQRLGQDQPMSSRALESLAEPWRPFRWMAASYLWMAPVVQSAGAC